MPDNLTTDTEQQKMPVNPTEETKANGEANREECAHDKLYENHPLRPLMGKYKDDPTWDEFMENIREYRRQVDEMTKEQE